MQNVVYNSALIPFWNCSYIEDVFPHINMNQWQIFKFTNRSTQLIINHQSWRNRGNDLTISYRMLWVIRYCLRCNYTCDILGCWISLNDDMVHLFIWKYRTRPPITLVWHCGCAYQYFFDFDTYLLLLISMLWHRQAIFESKGDKLSSSAEGRIRTHQGLRHQIASRLHARWQTDWAIEDQVKNLNLTARPYDQRAFSPLDPTAVWHFHLALAIYQYVVVKFDALAQASDTRIERRQVVFLCWRQDSNPSGSQAPNRQQTECPLTNGLSYRGSS